MARNNFNRIVCLCFRASCRLLLYSVLLVSVTCFAVHAEELSVSSEVKGFSSRLLDEGADLATTPFTVKDGNLFWTLGIAGAIGLTYAYDSNIRDKLQGSVHSRSLDKATDAGELVGNPYLHLGVAALVYTTGVAADSKKWKETGEMLTEALVLADGATLLIKEASGRGRPVATEHKGDYKPFGFRNDYDSFPSMHTASSFAMASVIAHTSDSVPIAVLSYSTAAFVGFSRMYQNKHWATDVLLGAAIGELSGRIVSSYHTKQAKRISIMPGFNGDAVSMNLLYRF